MELPFKVCCEGWIPTFPAQISQKAEKYFSWQIAEKESSGLTARGKKLRRILVVRH